MTTAPNKVAVLIYDGVELLDFCGPVEVFAVANRCFNAPVFEIYLVALKETITACGGVSVNRTHGMDACPQSDLLLVPGGAGVDELLKCKSTAQWVVSQSRHAKRTASVCSGALILGSVGLLDNLNATTHSLRMQQLKQIAPNANVVDGPRYVDNGQILTSAGISTGIDLCLHIVSRLLGQDFALQIANRMEYGWQVVNERTE